jgi:uncharacterized membrane protein YdjX (TVP38/TMEM64 family)
MDKKNLATFVAILKLIILIGLIAGLSILFYLYYPEFAHKFEDIDDLKGFLIQYQAFGIVIYIFLQILQVVISVIPGQILQFAAGYVYGFFLGTVLSMLGVALGTIITFYIARILGKDAMHIIFGERRITKFVQLLNQKRSYIILLIFFAIPGLPKDLMTYAAGISEIKLKPFLILSLAGRAPALMVTVAMSRMLYNGSYLELILLILAMVFLFVFCIIKKSELIKLGNKFYDKMLHAKW